MTMSMRIKYKYIRNMPWKYTEADKVIRIAHLISISTEGRSIHNYYSARRKLFCPWGAVLAQIIDPQPICSLNLGNLAKVLSEHFH